MRAAYIYGARDVRIAGAPRPGPAQLKSTDAIVRVVRAAICGTDLHPYRSRPASGRGRTIGHEFIGVVEDIGADVSAVKAGDFVVAPFFWSDGTCPYCELAGGQGVHAVVEAVGYAQAYRQAAGIVRPGGVISRVGLPQYQEGRIGGGIFNSNITITGGGAGPGVHQPPAPGGARRHREPGPGVRPGR